MADIGNISRFSAVGPSGLYGTGEPNRSTADSAGGQLGQSPMHELASLLAETLLSDKSGQASSQTGNAGQSLLEQLQGDNMQADGACQDQSASGGADSDSKELLTQVLIALFEKILGGENGSAGTAVAGGAGQNGQGGLGGLGGSEATGGFQGLGGNTAAGESTGVEQLANPLLKALSQDSLNKSISPTDNGAGQVSSDEQLKALLELVAQFMDSHPETFGQPSGGGEGSPASGANTPTSPSSPTSPEAPGTPTAAAPPSVPGADGTEAGAGVSTVAFPTPSSNPTVVNETIKVGPGEVFDGKGQTFTAGSALGDGGQGEGQKPLFELAEGATLKNVVLGENGADGVHVKAGGEATVNVDNVHWTNVGEDALTVKEGGAGITNLNITNSSAQGASDKIFQLNANANVTVDNFKANNFGTFMRTNGGQQGDWNLDLSNIKATNGMFSFVKSDSEGLNLKTQNIDLVNVQNAYSKLPESTNRQGV